MTYKFLLPVVAGLSIVLQGALNRNSSANSDLSSVVFVNAIVFLVFSVVVLALIKFNFINGTATPLNPFSNFQWWHVFPGFFGFLIVFSTPLAIEFLGANVTFAVIICTQLVVSMIWDSYVEKRTPTAMSLVGVSVMIVGLAVLMLGKNK
ncbi:MAG: DMT family transporter [Pseudobdellovibrionaceae bacterium]